MRLEAVVPEAQREKIRRAAESGVGSASVGGGREHRAFRGSALQNLFELASLYQRNIRGNDERAVDAARHAEARGHFNGAGFTGICGVGNDLEIVLLREVDRERIAGDEGAGRAVRPAGKCRHNVMQHGTREFRARGLIEHGGEPLLGSRQILDWNEDHGRSEAVRAAGLPETGWSESSPLMVEERTARAKSARSSEEPMMVCVHCTRKPVLRSASAARTSRVSQTRRSRKSSYAFATPTMEHGSPCAVIRIPAGPAMGAFPTIGLTAATLPRVLRRASRIPGTESMGPMLVMGLLGAIITASAEAMASSTPGAGSASEAPAKRTDLTGS